MTISINVSRGPYRAGSTVAGRVELPIGRDYNVQSITISFSGRCKSKVTEGSSNNSRTRHYGRVQLFYFKQTLFTGPYTLHGNATFPFSFTFPDRCSSDTRSPLADNFQPSRFFDDNRQQPLPASFRDSSTTIGQDIEVFVSYELEANLVSTKTFGGNMETTVTLHLVQDRLIENPDLMPHSSETRFSVRSKYLLPEFQEHEPTLSKKLNALINPSKMPIAVFRLYLSMPTVGIVGQDMPLTLRLEHDLQNSTVRAPPVVHLRRIKWTLQATTWLRCTSAGLFASQDVLETCHDEHTIADYQASDLGIPTAGCMNLGDLLACRGLTRKTNVSPSFKTFNVSRVYSLRVKLSIECAKEKFTRVLTGPEFLLLPKTYVPHLLQTDDQLPSHQDASKS